MYSNPDQMGQRSSRRERERREEEAMIREIEQTLNQGMLLADKLTKEIFPTLQRPRPTQAKS